MDEDIGTNLAGLTIGTKTGVSPYEPYAPAKEFLKADHVRQVALDMAIRAQAPGENKTMTLDRAEAFYLFLCQRYQGH